MRPEDERTDQPPENDAGLPPEGDPGEHELPPPATFAGRRRAQDEDAQADAETPSNRADEDAAAPEEEPGGALDPDNEVRAGSTEEHDQIERDLEGELGDLEGDSSEHDVVEAESEAEDSGATVEADTLSLADRAEAEEQALAALRARSAQSAPPPGAQADAAPKDEKATGTQGDAAAEPEAAEPDEPEAAEPAQPVAVAATADDEGKPPRARPIWLRFLTASFVIVASMAAATSISLLVYLTDIARGLEDNGLFAKIGDQLDQVEGGDPQTILILGSDKRPTDESGRSDTTILLRVDPDRDRVALLSIPRDLRVNIPGVGTDKLNTAYSVGGADKTFKVVKNLVGIPIHHVVNINFTGFADAVNAIGCVYIDVDRRYFIPAESDISEIDIDAGYQRLCGYKALQYVRFRHEDTDLVRSARQQDFLREARQKLSPEQIVRDSGYRGELIDIFTDYTTSDINSATQLLDLIKTFLGAADATVNEVHFPAELGGPNSAYVDADPEAIEKAVDEFLNGEGTPGPAPSGEREDEEEAGSGGGDKPKKDKQQKQDKPEPSGPPMDDSSVLGEQAAVELEAVKKKSGKPMLDFPVQYPTRILPGSTLQTTETGASRAFVIDGPSDEVYHGYKIVVDYFGQGGFSEYYGVSGTDWLDAPILENPSEVRRIDGNDYLLFYDGDRLRLVGWKTGKAVYWVQNTLAQALDEDVMLSIATSARKLGG